MERRRRLFWRIWCGTLVVSLALAWIPLRPAASFLTVWHLRGVEPPRVADTLPKRAGDRASDLRAVPAEGPATHQQLADSVAMQDSFARQLARERRHALRKLALFIGIIGLVPPLLAIFATALRRPDDEMHHGGNSHAMDGR